MVKNNTLFLVVSVLIFIYTFSIFRIMYTQKQLTTLNTSTSSQSLTTP